MSGGRVPVYITAGGSAVAKYVGRSGDGVIRTSGKGEELRKDNFIMAVKQGAAVAKCKFDDIDKMIEITISYDVDTDQPLCGMSVSTRVGRAVVR